MRGAVVEVEVEVGALLLHMPPLVQTMVPAPVNIPPEVREAPVVRVLAPGRELGAARLLLAIPVQEAPVEVGARGAVAQQELRLLQ